jgi:hypothetical protein
VALSVRSAARMRCLYILREAARLSPEATADLLVLDASVVMAAADTLPVRLGAAAAMMELKERGFPSIPQVNTAVNSFRAALSGEPGLIPYRVANCGIRALAAGSDLARISTSECRGQLAPDAEAVAQALDAGIQALEILDQKLFKHVIEYIDLCAGLVLPRGTIKSFSNVDSPGLVFFSIDNPPLLIAEQLVHEATHVALYLRTEDDTELSDAFETTPACYSPFTDSVRPAERVFHGIVSYAKVRRLWIAARDSECQVATWLDGAVTYQDSISKRIESLNLRIETGWRSLIAATTDSEAETLLNAYLWLVGEAAALPLLGGSENSDLEQLAFLSDIQLAEVVLAVKGEKVSRITLMLQHGSEARALLDYSGTCCFSTRAFRNKKDPNIKGFANSFAAAVPLIGASPTDEVLAYVAKTKAEARLAFDLDQDDAAGELFQIPDCCSRFFAKNWEKVRSTHADLYSFHLRGAVGRRIFMPWQCNAAAMYAGGGLCWHFPCSLDCDATKTLVTRRAAALAQVDAELLERLVHTQRLPFAWSAGAYGFGSTANVTSLSDLEWTTEAPLGAPTREIDVAFVTPE